jgi:thermostable 8-oxoguanine DNA glycosylase
MLAIEVQGVQHSEMNSFFHKRKSDFRRQLSRDEDKRFFCELNDITLIEVTKPKQLEELLDATN